MEGGRRAEEDLGLVTNQSHACYWEEKLRCLQLAER